MQGDGAVSFLGLHLCSVLVFRLTAGSRQGTRGPGFLAGVGQGMHAARPHTFGMFFKPASVCSLYSLVICFGFRVTTSQQLFLMVIVWPVWYFT